MFGKRNAHGWDQGFALGYYVGKAITEAELRFSIGEQEAIGSLRAYTQKRCAECPKGEKLNYIELVRDWLGNMKTSLFYVIPGGKT